MPIPAMKKNNLFKALGKGVPLITALNSVRISYRQYRTERQHNPEFGIHVDNLRNLHYKQRGW